MTSNSKCCLRPDGVKYETHVVRLNKKKQLQCWWCDTIFTIQKGERVNHE
jgi:hypothetical protein